MSAISKSLADALYKLVLQNTAFSPPGTVYLSLHISGGSDPAHPGKGEETVFNNEADYTGYQRQAITMDDPDGTGKAEGDNTNSIVFPTVPAGVTPFEVTGLAIWSDEKAGTFGDSGQLLLAGEIDDVKEMAPGDAPLVSIGSVIAVFGQDL